jgi:hypothetical protein
MKISFIRYSHSTWHIMADMICHKVYELKYEQLIFLGIYTLLVFSAHGDNLTLH